VFIDEPELGLHPDMIPTLADLLRDAATRTQLIVTTHSRDLIDCFTTTPEVVLVCEKVNGQTYIEQANAPGFKKILERKSLGRMWSEGHIGGNRW
jgi:predicted ATPase